MLSSEPILADITKESRSKFGSYITPDQSKDLQELQSQYFTAIDKSIEQVKQILGKETLKASLRVYLASVSCT